MSQIDFLWTFTKWKLLFKSSSVKLERCLSIKCQIASLGMNVDEAVWDVVNGEWYILYG